MAVLITRTRCIVAVAFVLSTHLLCVSTDMAWGFFYYVIFYPPVMLFGGIRGDANMRNAKVCVMIALAYGGLVAAYSLHFTLTAGYLNEDSAMPWLELIRSTSALYFLPFFFGFIRQRNERGRERAVSPPFVVTLPGGIVAGFAILPGSPMNTVARSNDCRAAVYYYCSYLIYCACTLVLAAASAWFGLIAAGTSLAYVAVCSVVSIVLHILLSFFKKLNTPKYSDRATWALVPVLTATFLLQAYGGVELKQIGWYAVFVRNLIWHFMIPVTGFANIDE